MADTDTVRLHWRKTETHGLLPDPEPRPITHTLFSTDDHLVEPPHMFEGRLPARLQADAPKVIETEEGHEVWQFDGKIFFQVGLNAVVGRKTEDWKVEPTRFEEMRAGCYDVDARVRDMDINGVWASVNFPSQITGFCGSVFSRCSDPDLGLAVPDRRDEIRLAQHGPGGQPVRAQRSEQRAAALHRSQRPSFAHAAESRRRV